MDGRELTDAELERLIRAAMRRNGMLLPTTVEDVRAAEAWLEANPIELPESLRDPAKVLEMLERGRDEAG
jgi:hypothetical protein